MIPKFRITNTRYA